MNVRTEIRSGIRHVGQALRDPELFAERWNTGEANYRWWVWAALTLTAILGTTTYGMTMGLLGGAEQVLQKSIKLTLAAGVAWAIPLPALYILNSLSGSRLKASSTLLAALVTVSWGGLAMMASIPVNWFLSAAIPHAGFVLIINLVVFAGVGTAMGDVFQRVMSRLEPHRAQPPMWWLFLVAAMGAELFYCLGIFEFAVA
jgi:hypothetical protein